MLALRCRVSTVVLASTYVSKYNNFLPKLVILILYRFASRLIFTFVLSKPTYCNLCRLFLHCISSSLSFSSERERIGAVAQAGWLWSIVKYMSQMCATLRTHDLSSYHTVLLCPSLLSHLLHLLASRSLASQCQN